MIGRKFQLHNTTISDTIAAFWSRAVVLIFSGKQAAHKVSNRVVRPELSDESVSNALVERTFSLQRNEMGLKLLNAIRRIL